MPVYVYLNGKRKVRTMSDEVKGFDAESFFKDEETSMTTEAEEIIKEDEAGTVKETETVAKQPEAKVPVAVEPKVEAPQQQPEKSIMADLIKQELGDHVLEEKPKEQDKVPLSELIKVRKRAQDAEAKLEMLQQQKAPEVPDIDDEDYITGAQMKQVLNAQLSYIQQQQKAETVRMQLETAVEKSLRSEAEFQKSTPDYLAVTTAAKSLNLVTGEDFKTVLFASDNPAKAYYDLCQQKLNAVRSVLGVPVGNKSKPSETINNKDVQQETPADDTQENKDLTDDEVFSQVFGK